MRSQDYFCLPLYQQTAKIKTAQIMIAQITPTAADMGIVGLPFPKTYSN